jgi:hypothetical protein
MDRKLIRSAGIEYEKIPIEYSIQKNLTLARSKLGIWIDDGAIHSNQFWSDCSDNRCTHFF